MSEALMERTCTGRCCTVFYLPKTEAELAAGFAGRVSGGQQILNMIEPLTFDAAAERWEAIWHEPLREGLLREDGAGHLYTCRHWDERSGLCGIYESRPSMCSTYPYDRACDYCEYTIPEPVGVSA
jgi:Fe-S-cluster containining protein